MWRENSFSAERPGTAGQKRLEKRIRDSRRETAGYVSSLTSGRREHKFFGPRYGNLDFISLNRLGPFPVAAQFLWNKQCGYSACDHCLAALETASDNLRRLTKDPDVAVPHPGEWVLVLPLELKGVRDVGPVHHSCNARKQLVVFSRSIILLFSFSHPFHFLFSMACRSSHQNTTWWTPPPRWNVPTANCGIVPLVVATKLGASIISCCVSAPVNGMNSIHPISSMNSGRTRIFPQKRPPSTSLQEYWRWCVHWGEAWTAAAGRFHFGKVFFLTIFSGLWLTFFFVSRQIRLNPEFRTQLGIFSPGSKSDGNWQVLPVHIFNSMVLLMYFSRFSHRSYVLQMVGWCTNYLGIISSRGEKRFVWRSALFFTSRK